MVTIRDLTGKRREIGETNLGLLSRARLTGLLVLEMEGPGDSQSNPSLYFLRCQLSPANIVVVRPGQVDF